MHSQKAYLVLFSMMLVSFLSTAGIALPYPILAPLFMQGGGSQLLQFAGLDPKILLALLLAVYPLGLLIGTSFIGAMSDIYGRKKTLMVSLFLSILGYLLTAYALQLENYALFLTARFFTGLFEGNLPIARAIAADLHPEVDKTRGMSWMYAANYAGWLVGPLVGGYLMASGPEVAFYVAAAAIGFAALFCYVLLPNDSIEIEHSASLFVNRLAKQNSLGLLKHHEIRHIFGFYLLLNLGLNAFYEFYPLWLVDVFSFDSINIGHITVVVTLCMIITSATVVEKSKNKFGKIPTILTALTLLSLALMAVPWVNQQLVWIYFGVIGALIALYSGLIPVYVSDRYEHLGQGKILGLLTTGFYLANAIIALIGGGISLLGSQWSIAFGGLLMFCSMLYLFTFDRRYPPEPSPLSENI